MGSEDHAAPYSISWNTLTTANGIYTLTARARDAAGNTTISTGVMVTVNNDIELPTVSVTAPATGTVTGTINVNANAADNVGVMGVQFLLNGVNLGTEDVAAPYSVSWNTLTSANGTYTLTARARDAAGNTAISTGVIVSVFNDTQLPTVSLTAPAAGNVTGNINVTANATDNVGVAGVQFLLNGSNLGAEDIASPFSISWITTSVPNGIYTLIARARDAAGNSTTSAGISVTVNNPDIQLPVVSIAAPAAGNVLGTINVTAVASDNVGITGIQFLLDGASIDAEDLIAPYSVSWNTTTVVDGNYTLTAIARDEAGNIATSAGVIVNVLNHPPDTEFPIINITLPVAGTVAGMINVTASASDNIGITGVQFVLDGVNLGTEDMAAPYTVSWNTTTVTDGSHTLTALARDGAGNTATSAGIIVNVLNNPPDTELPTITIISPAAGTVTGTVNVTATANDNEGVIGVQFLSDGVNLGAEDLTASYSRSWNTTTVTDGSHILTAIARDRAGNTATSAGIIVNVLNNPPDTELPTITIISPAAGTVTGTVNVTATANDNEGVIGVQFLLDGVNLGAEDLTASYSRSWNTTTVTDGSHVLTAIARDAAGNTATSAGVIVNVLNHPPDTEFPIINITSPAAGTITGTINVTANASDNVGITGVQFLLDGVNLGAEDLTMPYSRSWNTTTIGDGSHILTAIARDAAGNTATSTPVIVTVNNDTQIPTVSITAPVSGPVTGTINVTASATDNVSVAGVQFLLDGVNLGTEDLIAPYTVSWNTTTAADGNHTIVAIARDAAGNTTTSAGVIVTVFNDTEAPTVTITAPAGGNVLGTINVTVSASDNVAIAGVQFLLNGVNVGIEDMAAPYSLSWNTTTIADGNYTLTARARDAAGNTAISGGVIVNVLNHPSDTQLPTVSITSPTAGTFAGTINVTASASDNIGVTGVQFLLNGVSLGTEDLAAPYTVSWNTTTGINGNYTLTARARDAAGNTATSIPVVVTVNNDIELPTVSVTAPSAGTVTATINVNANAADNVGVMGVQFLLNGVNLGSEDVAAPYSISWNTLTSANGTYTLTARARDAAGNTAISTGVIVTVFNDTELPTVSITSPAAGTVAGTINVTAGATDNVGIAGVQFLLNGVNLGTEDMTAPYSVSWNTTTAVNGNYTLTARARDAAGNNATSTTLSVTVNNPDIQLPVVSITSPVAGTVAGTINVTASASDNIGITGVQFLLDGVNLSTEDLIAPYSVSWNTTTVTDGSHTLTAIARDGAGNTSISSTLTVSVNNTNLVAAFGFNENTGTTLADNSGNNNNGTLSGSPTWSASGKYGTAIQFDGIDDLININDANTLDLTNGMTMEAWINPGNLTGYKTIICKDDGTNNLAYAISGNDNNSVTANQRPNSRIVIGSATRTVTGTSKLSLNTWTHIASTYDGTTLRLFVNGVQVSALATTGNIKTTTNMLRIGGSPNLGTQYFSGLIDEVRIYRRALSQAEIQTDMNTPIVPDVTVPAVNITHPANGSVVMGTLNVTANASDNISVVGVQFLLDGVNLGAEDIITPYSVSWNTITIANGNHTLTAIARDAAGNRATSAGVIVTANNDTQSPTVIITEPVAGIVTGTVSISASASDNVGISGVQFFLDGITLGTEDIAAPYSVSWNTTITVGGHHTLTAIARDAAGNTTISPPLTVTVNNTKLVVALGFNENTGTTLTDNSGHNNHGTLSGSPAWSASGKYGAAIQFDGIDDLVNISDANSLDLTNGMTLEAWVNPGSLTDYKTVICKENGANNFAYVLSANNNTSGTANQRPENRILIGTTTNTITGTTKLALNTWTHIACTYDGINMMFYINSVLVSAFAASGNIITTTNPLRIGGSTALAAQYFAGLIDEVRIYSRALSQAEIQTDMNTPIASSNILLEGFGSQAIGGSLDATVYHVTTVSGTGAGSLYYGINNSGNHKTIVFDVSGTINQRHDIINNSYLTIDGTTAPYPGIIITTSNGDGMSVRNKTSHHIIIKGLTFKNCSNDGLNVIDSAHDVMITNCSAYGNEDGNIDIASDGTHHVTVQYCIIGNHNWAPSHGTGGILVTGQYISVHHNLFNPISPNPAEGERFPFVHCNYSDSVSPNADIRNNIVWNYGRNNSTGLGYGSGVGYNARANIINNYYQTISGVAAQYGVDLDPDGGHPGFAYTSGNVSGNGYNFNTGVYNNFAEFIIPPQYSIQSESACVSAVKVLANAGITQRSGGNRTAAEQAYINGVTTLTGCPYNLNVKYKNPYITIKELFLLYPNIR